MMKTSLTFSSTYGDRENMWLIVSGDRSSKRVTKGLTVKGTSPSESLRQPVYHPTLDYRSRSSGYQSPP